MHFKPFDNCHPAWRRSIKKYVRLRSVTLIQEIVLCIVWFLMSINLYRKLNNNSYLYILSINRYLQDFTILTLLNKLREVHVRALL